MHSRSDVAVTVLTKPRSNLEGGQKYFLQLGPSTETCAKTYLTGENKSTQSTL